VAQNWLFDGLEIPDTLMVVTRTETVFLASSKKGALPGTATGMQRLTQGVGGSAAMLSAIKGVGSSPAPIRVVERLKTDTVGSKMDEVLGSLRGVVRCPTRHRAHASWLGGGVLTRTRSLAEQGGRLCQGPGHRPIPCRLGGGRAAQRPGAGTGGPRRGSAM
jgi:hypothetical protein